jgi:hypothetical protein
MANIELKRYTGSGYEPLYPKTDWSLIDNTPVTFTPTAHTHDASDINAGTLPYARGGTGATTYSIGQVVVTGTTEFTGRAISNSTSYGILSSTSTNIPTEQDVYWGTHYTQAFISAAIATSATYTTGTFGSGARNFVLYIHQDSTTGAVIAQIPLSITDTTHYILDTSVRTHRVSWSNGSVAQVMNVDIYYSGTTFYFRHNFSGANLAFRLFQY